MKNTRVLVNISQHRIRRILIFIFLWSVTNLDLLLPTRTTSMIVPMAISNRATTASLSSGRFISSSAIGNCQKYGNCNVMYTKMKRDEQFIKRNLCNLHGPYRQRHLVLFSTLSNSNDDIISPTSLNNKKRVIFLGSPPVAAETLQSIYDASQKSDSGFDIVAVISQPAKRGKRGAVEPTAVSKMAQELNISNIMTPGKASDPTFLQQFIDSSPDLCITAAYGQYLPKKFLQTPKYGTVNIHPSLLPKWRGASPVQRSLEAGDNPLGVTVLYTVSKMDAGPIIAQSTLEVQDHETTTTLLPKLFQIGTQSLIQVLPSIFDGTITIDTARIQNEDEATHAKLIMNDEAEFKVWNESATTCHNRLRGFHIWPKAFMYIQISNDTQITDDKKSTPPITMKIKIHETRVVPNIQLTPTNIIQTSIQIQDPVASSPAVIEGFFVVCYDGSVLELISIQPPSKTPYPARDLIHGYPKRTIRWVQQPLENDNEPIISSSKNTATNIQTATKAS